MPFSAPDRNFAKIAIVDERMGRVLEAEFTIIEKRNNENLRQISLVRVQYLKIPSRFHASE